MKEEIFQNRYRISSARAMWHNYNGGFYFVTICTHGRKHYFGEIVRNGIDEQPQMIMSPTGKFAGEQFRSAGIHYPYAEIPLWVVMPNHLHAIVGINHGKIHHDRRNVNAFYGKDASVETRCNNNVETRCNNNVETRCTTSLHREIANMQGWLSVVIGGLKRAVTHYANQNQIAFAWQTRFYDRIIRNTHELNSIAQYIENNVANWKEDCFYSE